MQSQNLHHLFEAKNASSAPWGALAIIPVVLILVAGGLLLLESPAPAPAPALPDPTFTFPQQYSAETRSGIESGQLITGRIYKDGDKVRTEIDSLGGDGVFINRPDLGKVFQLHASTKTITWKPWQAALANAGVTGPGIQFGALHPVDDDGVPCEMYFYKQDGKRSTVMVRLDTHAPLWLVTENGKIGISIHYENYKAGPPPASLFELPPDYQVVSNP